MRPLTAEEIREYLEFSRRELHPESFTEEQARLISQAVAEAGLMKSCARKIGNLLRDGAEPEDAFRSFWVMAFQMGRECESRLAPSKELTQ